VRHTYEEEQKPYRWQASSQTKPQAHSLVDGNRQRGYAQTRANSSDDKRRTKQEHCTLPLCLIASIAQEAPLEH
jgi:hypothetical protein